MDGILFRLYFVGVDILYTLEDRTGFLSVLIAHLVPILRIDRRDLSNTLPKSTYHRGDLWLGIDFEVSISQLHASNLLECVHDLGTFESRDFSLQWWYTLTDRGTSPIITSSYNSKRWK